MAPEDTPNEQCCTIPPFKSDYNPVGKTITLKVRGGEDLPVYVTGPEGAKTALVGIYGSSLSSISITYFLLPISPAITSSFVSDTIDRS